MNQLVLAFGIFGLLQGLSAEPKPEFGVKNTIPATSRITSVNGDIHTISNEIEALTVGAITSDMIQLLFIKAKIETLIFYFDRNLKAITTVYDAVVAATNNNIYNNFEPFLRAIDDTVTFAAGGTIPSELNGVTYTGISEELADVFERIVIGLTDLKSKTIDVRQALMAALDGEIDVDINEEITINTGRLRQYVTLKIMYDLLNSATKLRTYLPLVKYVLQTIIENLSEADTYVNSIKTALYTDVTAVSFQFTDDIDTIYKDIRDAVAAGFSSVHYALTTIEGNVAGMTGILNAQNGGVLKEKITSAKVMFETTYLGFGTTLMHNTFQHISVALASLIYSLQYAVSVNDNPLLNKLINTLMGNDRYGRYCYNKYKDLVKGLFDLSFNAGWLCLDKERARFEHLKSILILIIEQLAYDYDDIEKQIDVCNTLGLVRNSYTNTCVDALDTYYTDLFTATRDKIDLVFTIAQDEAQLNENRLLICFNLINLYTSVADAAAISEGLTICNQSGPTGTD